MKAKTKKECLDRMNYLKGHLEANRRMIEQNQYCIDIIQQNLAVIEAIKKVNHLVLDSHLDTCVTSAIKGKDARKRKKMLKELLKIYKEKK